MRAGWATVGESRGWLVRGWAAAGRREQDDQGMGTRRGAKAPDPAQWGPGEDLRPEPAVRRAPTSLGSGAQVGTQVGTRAATGRTTGPGLPVARALLPRAVFGEGTAREPSPGPPRTGAGPPAALRVSGLPPPGRLAVLGSLPKACAKQGSSCRDRASRFSEQQGAVVRRGVASRPRPSRSKKTGSSFPATETGASLLPSAPAPGPGAVRGAEWGGVGEPAETTGPGQEAPSPFTLPVLLWGCPASRATRFPASLSAPVVEGVS